MSLPPGFRATTLLVFTALSTSIVSAIPPLQLPDIDGIALDQGNKVSTNLINADPSQYRLPLDITPTGYYVNIQPILAPHPTFAQYSIPGYTVINGICNSVTKKIKLHTANTEIEYGADYASIIVRERSRRKPILNHEYDDDSDILTLNLVDDLEPGPMSIQINFVSQISLTELEGMYLSSYVDPVSGDTTELATTQLQPTSARKIFPSFDEPSFKARFTLAIGRLQQHHSLSNTIIENTYEGGDGYEFDVYQTTPVMSSYLLAIIVSDFTKEAVRDNSTFPVDVNIWGPKPYMDAQGGVYPAETVAKLLNYYQDLTGYTYELPKLDSAAIPQFSAGAMENWGLNTYRIEYLLHIPGENTEADRKKITQVLSHEVTHQWYGNLITCDWWAHTWLNEGFARFLQYRGMHHAAPELKNDIAIINDAVHLAMIFDHGPDTHPVFKDVVTQAEASDIFNRISYEKAASLLRTLESVLSREIFDNGIRRYLNAKMSEIFHSLYGSVLPDDLWDALQLEGGSNLPTGLTIHEMMKPWTELSGYPLVRVTSGGPNQIYISQEKFSLNTGIVANTNENQASSWNIPVSVISANTPSVGDRRPATWLLATNALTSYTNANMSTSDWIVVNAEVAAYYRVLYDTQLTNHLQRQLQVDHTVFTPGTRSQILEDYFQFANARYVPIEAALDLTKYMGKETELVAWTPVVTHIKSFIRRFSWDSASFDALANYFNSKAVQVLEVLDTIPEERGAHVILHAQLFDLAITFGDKERREYAAELFAAWLTQPTDRTIIPVDLRPMVFCAAVAEGDQSTWDTVLDLYRREYNFWTKAQLLSALSCASNVTVLENYVQLAMDPSSGLTLQSTLQAVAANSAGTALAYDYITKLVRDGLVPESDRIFANVLATLRTIWHDEAHLNQVETFVQDNEAALANFQTSIATSLSQIRDNILWWSQTGHNMVQWLLTN